MAVRIPRLDVERIVDVFGLGAKGCAHALQSVGFNVEEPTIKRWIDRERIPINSWLMISKAHEIKRGTPLDLNSFILEAK